MSAVVNLSIVRKAMERAKKRAEADQNAAKFGQTAGEKANQKAASLKAQAFMDGHKRQTE